MQRRIMFQLALVIVLLSGIGNAQTRNHSCSDSSLRGLTRLFIDTGDDQESRQNMVEVIEKEFPEITVVDRKDQAEMLIIYFHRVERRETDGAQVRHVEATVEVLIGSGQYRKVYTHTGQATCGAHDKKEARRFARSFINVYEAVNR